MSMDNADGLAKTFLSDVECIAEGFIKCFDLAFNQEEPILADPLCRWVDFVLRYVEPVPRRVEFSHEFWQRTPEDLTTTVKRFAHRGANGQDINPYQGRGLTAHDVSTKRSAQRTDLLWADWGIHHFHLTDTRDCVG